MLPLATFVKAVLQRNFVNGYVTVLPPHPIVFYTFDSALYDITV